MTKKLVLIGVLLLVLPFAMASSITSEPIKDKISPYEFARFNITVHNTGAPDKFVLSYDDLDWVIQTDPLTDYTTGMFVGAGSSYETTLLAKPSSDSESVFRRHNLEIDAKSANTGEDLSTIITVEVRKDLIRYDLKVNVNFLMPEQISPVRTNSVKVRLENTNPLNVTSLDIFLESSLFEKKTSVTLEPNAEKVVDFSVVLDNMLQPQDDEATLTVKSGNLTIAKITKSYSVVPYGKFYSTTNINEIFLGREKIIRFSNTGNSEQTEEVLISAGGGFERLFSSTDPATKVKRMNEKAYYSAELTLSPEESATFRIRTSYAPILYVVIMLMVAGILYFAFRKPILVAKEAKEIDVVEGGIAKLSVLIKLKNRSNKQFKKVKLIDKVPSIAKVQIKESETMKPTKHYTYKDGMVLEYDLGKVEPGEVRFISYHLKTKLAVVGGLRLKPVIVQYGKKKSYSNPVEVYTP